MNNQATNHDAHLADDELLRFIDGENDPRQEEWVAHIGSCEQCSRDAELLSGDSRVLTRWLQHAAFEERDTGTGAEARATGKVLPFNPHAARRPAAAAGRGERRSVRPVPPWLRAAAVLVLLASPVAAMPSLRQWIAATLTGREEPAGEAAVMQQGAPAYDVAAIRFVPVPGVFVVRLDAWQAGGTLRLEYGATADAVLQMSGAGTEPVVSAASLQLRNQPASSVGYTLQLPEGVTGVEVHVAGRPADSFNAAALRAGAELHLQR
jgi:hypothetical protein